jgi:hypothetical protein
VANSNEIPSIFLGFSVIMHAFQSDLYGDVVLLVMSESCSTGSLQETLEEACADIEKLIPMIMRCNIIRVLFINKIKRQLAFTLTVWIYCFFLILYKLTAGELANWPVCQG